MLSLPPSVRLFVATQPIDGRKGADSLMVLVRDVFRLDPLSGHLFVFFTKRCDRIRIVYWDRNGFALWTKRLERGRFRPPLSAAVRRWRAQRPCHRGRGIGADRRRHRSAQRAPTTSVAAWPSGLRKRSPKRIFLDPLFAGCASQQTE